MPVDSELLVVHGFTKSDTKEKYEGKTPQQRKEFIEKLKEKKGADKVNETLDSDADQDMMELTKDQLVTVPYPKPITKYYLVYESPNQSIEPIYFWALNHLQYDLGFPWVEKVTDLFTASEHSSFYGAGAQRLGLAQDKVQQFLAAIGGFIRKDLFQLVRDIKWLDERINYHEEARKFSREGKHEFESAEITLKGIWTDLVDGVVQGQRVSANVFQMSQQLQFSSLPDLFFSIHVKDASEVDKVVNNVTVSQVVKNVLKRKLRDFATWKEYNHKELTQRRKFELNYLRQHYNIIRMYMAWIKPYLKHIERLRSDVTKLSKPEIVAAFEGSMVDIEILASKIPEKNKKFYSCVLMTFEYRTKPSLSFSQEGGYHRGPVHVGETKITWRSYAWTKEQISNFMKMKEQEDFELLSSIDSSIKSAMDAIGRDLWAYLKEAEEVTVSTTQKEQEEVREELIKNLKKTGVPKEKIDEVLKSIRASKTGGKKQAGFMDPFKGIGGGLKEMVTAFMPKREQLGMKPKTSKQAKAEKKADEAEKSAAKKDAQKTMWVHYKNFKKVNGMLTW